MRNGDGPHGLLEIALAPQQPVEISRGQGTGRAFERTADAAGAIDELPSLIGHGSRSSRIASASRVLFVPTWP